MPTDLEARVPVNIAVTHEGDGNEVVGAICNDASMWIGEWLYGGGFSWRRLPDIPQDDDD